jgi:hypothetical protein
MITLIRANRRQLTHHFSQSQSANQPAKPLWLIKPRPNSSCWKPLRDLISQVAGYIGQSQVDVILAQDPAAASFVYQEHISQLDAYQSAQRHYYSTRITSHLSHNWYLHRPLFEAWATLIHHLLRTGEYTVFAPFSADLVGPVNGILKTFNRLYPGKASHILIGFETDMSAPTYDENGINWNMRSSNPRFAGGFLQVADRVLSLADITPQADKLCWGEVAVADALNVEQTLIHDNEYTALNLLADSSNTLSPEQTATVITTMQNAFAGIDFQNTLALGLQLLAQNPQLSQADQATIHGLTALAAHNRQFQAKDLRLHHFLEKHFLAAYEAHSDSFMRSIFAYRLAVTYGRRMKDVDKGLLWAEKAMTIAAAPQLSENQRVYCYNWGVNIKSYLQMLDNQLEQAFDTGFSVFHTLHQHYQQLLEAHDGAPDRAVDPISQMWQRELFNTVQVLRRNMFILSFKTAHLSQFKYWLDQMELITSDAAALRRATSGEWAEYYNALLQPQKVLDYLTLGFKYLSVEPESELFLHYNELALKAHYQIGNTQGAKTYLTRYREALDSISMPWHFYLDISQYAHIYLCSGQSEDLHQLEQDAAKALQTQTNLPDKVELLLILAQIQAKRQLLPSTEELVNKAIELAVADGERNLMMRIARVAGLCNRWLGKPTEAVEAYQQALSLAQHESDKEPWPEELFLTLIGIQEINGGHAILLIKTLQLLPQALKKQDAWWQLNTLLTLLNELNSQDPAAFITLAKQQPLTTLISTAGQREDCKRSLEILQAALKQA